MKSYFLFILVLLLDTTQAVIAEKVQICSASMEKNIPALVVIPDNYAQRALHLNTILILHVHGYLPIRNPELFSSASSMSGGVDLRHSTKRWGIAQKLGPYKKFPHHWEQYSIVGIISDLEKLASPVIIDCGTDDFFIEINRELYRMMLNKGIDHLYTEFPSAHTWEYWVHALDYHLYYLQHQFKYQ